MAQTKTQSLLNKKKPKDDAEHLDFSVTRNVSHHDNYRELVKRRGFTHHKHREEQELAEDIRRQGWWQTLEEKIEEQAQPIVKNNAGFVTVKKAAHRRSPYVTRIVPPEPKSKPKVAAKVAGREWLYQVERLRREGAEKYKNKLPKIQINFLTRRRDKIKAQRQALPKSRRSVGRVLGAVSLAIVMWLFEFILSIPLGLLLVAHGLLLLVEKLSGLLIGGGRGAGRGLIWFINEVFTGLVALLKGFIMVPLKILALMFLAVFRLLSSLGLALATGFREVWQTTKQIGKTLTKTPRRTLKQALGAAGLAALLVAPVKFLPDTAANIRSVRGQVLGAAENGFNLLRQGQAEAAGRSWREAQTSLESVNVVLRTLIKLSPQGAAATDLIQAGEDIASAAEYVGIGLAPFTSQAVADGDVITAVKNLSGALSLASPRLDSAQKLLSQTSSDVIPEDYRAKFMLSQTVLPKVNLALSDLIKLSDGLVTALGGEGERRYAILFQNNNELRPAGGFIGSLALVTADKGRITKIDIPGGGSYDWQGYLTKHVLAPKPLSLINARWQLQDANWYPDWPTSAEKVAWFLEQAGESSVDGVIALQATSLQELLRLLGPIDFPDYKVTLNADNVIAEIQTAVELEYDKKENKPKQYIAELAPKILDKILSGAGGGFLKLFNLMQKEIAGKNVLIYFRDSNLNQEFIARGWEPTIANTDLDYLSVVHANIGGGKTDGVIEESWDQQIEIAEDGSAMAELTISRFHKGDPNDPFEKANNVDYVRVYAPAGSELIDAYGFKAPDNSLFEKAEDFYTPDEQLIDIEGKVLVDEATGTRITQEFGKTVFGNWLQVSPGKTAQAVFRYKLPFKVMPGGYSLVIQKQPGARPIDYTINISYPASWNVAWKKVAGEGTIDNSGNGKLLMSGILTKDTGFATLFTE